MIVLDTNVVSEMMRPAPSEIVSSWFAKQPTPSLFLSAVSEAELRYGIERLPPGKRRDLMASALESLLTKDLAGPILPFDSDAAVAYAVVAWSRRSAGRPISQLDCQIAAIARSRGAAVATRDTADFEHTGIKLIDPWRH